MPPSALMRFCQIMGFSGFAEMQRLFREAYARGWPDYATRLANLKAGAARAARRRWWPNSSRRAACRWRRWRKIVDEAALDQAVDAAGRGRDRSIWSGLRRSFPVASYLAYVFDKLAGSGHAA